MTLRLNTSVNKASVLIILSDFSHWRQILFLRSQVIKTNYSVHLKYGPLPRYSLTADDMYVCGLTVLALMLFIQLTIKPTQSTTAKEVCWNAGNVALKVNLVKNNY